MRGSIITPRNAAASWEEHDGLISDLLELRWRYGITHNNAEGCLELQEALARYRRKMRMDRGSMTRADASGVTAYVERSVMVVVRVLQQSRKMQCRHLRNLITLLQTTVQVPEY